MKTLTVALGALLAVAGSVLPAWAGPEKISYPHDWKTRFVKFNDVERPDRKPAIVRDFYVNPEAASAAKPGQPLPDGTVLVMVDVKVRLNDKGEPERNAEGRMIPTGEVTGVAVQEKRKGWGADYAMEKRNGEWEYALFTADGKPREGAKYDSCFTCHKTRAQRDFTFLYYKNVMDAKK